MQWPSARSQQDADGQGVSRGRRRGSKRRRRPAASARRERSASEHESTGDCDDRSSSEPTASEERQVAPAIVGKRKQAASAGGERLPCAYAPVVTTRECAGPRAWHGMTDRDDFLAWVKTTLYKAELALHNGDAAPRRALWSRNEPVSVLGAWRNANGQHELDELFISLARSFSDCTAMRSNCRPMTWWATWPTPPGLSTLRPPSTVIRAATPCGPHRCTVARATNGR
jgi:hypothetical protein